MKKKVKIIAEIGVNHNGSISLAKQLISTVAKLDVDYVKFQSFSADRQVGKNAKKANYQIEKKKKKESQHQMLKKLELKENHYKILYDHCRKKKVKFLLSFFDIESLKWVKKFNLQTIKIPSGEINNFLLLREIGKLKRNVILSTGISTIKEIGNALNLLISSGTKKQNITVLHCNSAYPTPLQDVNMRAMITIKNVFKVKIGYSDHTESFESALAAVALGAEVIEKHFTLNKNLSGPDHKASMNPNEFRKFLEFIKNTEILLGSPKKRPTNSENKNKQHIRKSIVAKKNIIKGEKFSPENLSTMRPGGGISPNNFFKIIGKKAKQNYLKGTQI